MPVSVKTDGPAEEWFNRGKELYYTRVGQLDMSCANCHEEKVHVKRRVVAEQVSGNTNNIKEIANLGVEHGKETRNLSQNLLQELTTLHNLISQFDT